MRIGFRTRLAFLFVLVAIVPLALLTFFYVRFLAGTIEYWQNPGIERTIENSLAVARQSLEQYRERAARAGEFVVILLDPGGGPEETSRFLEENASELGVDLLAIYREDEEGWSLWASGGAGAVKEILDPQMAAAALGRSVPPPLDLEDPSVLAVLPVGENASEGLLLVGVKPPGNVMTRIRRLAADVDLYRRLAGYERMQIATVILGTLSVVALVVIASLVVARMLARSISRPILELVEGTRRLSSGDLNHPVAVRAKDEIGLLVDSFNRMTADLRVSKDNLRRAERVAAWRDVARRIAHEIKNPLTPIQLSIHRLRKRVPGEDPATRQVYAECLDLMDAEVANLRRLADEFSQFARMPPPSPEPSSLPELCRAVVDLYRESNPDVDVELEPADRLPDVPVDPDQFRRALGNLVKNAMEAMPSGGALRVRLEPSAAAGRSGVRVTVSDTGPGLPAGVRDHVFEPYVTTKKQGSGLGLAIVHRIVTDHGGSIEVESGEGRGTTFRLFFPGE